jgi:hypothetical protein
VPKSTTRICLLRSGRTAPGTGFFHGGTIGWFASAADEHYGSHAGPAPVEQRRIREKAIEPRFIMDPRGGFSSGLWDNERGLYLQRQRPSAVCLGLDEDERNAISTAVLNAETGSACAEQWYS